MTTMTTSTSVLDDSRAEAMAQHPAGLATKIVPSQAPSLVNPLRGDGITLRGVLETVHDNDTGAQAMEYIALACGGIGLVSVIAKLFTDPELVRRITEIVIMLLEVFTTLF